MVCTSGTAVANLLPAVVEAAHAGLPLVVVTADRPARLRGTGANQTTDQVGMFGAFAPTPRRRRRRPRRVVARPQRGAAGPVHLNVQLDEPLLPDDGGLAGRARPAVVGRPRPPAPDGATDRSTLGPRTVVVAGDDAGPPARVLAEKAGWPLLAEPSSGCRTGDHVIRTYRLLLAASWARRSSGSWSTATRRCPARSRACSRRDDVEVVSAPAPRQSGPTGRSPVAREVDRSTSPGPDDPAWLEAWRDGRPRQSRAGSTALLAAEPDLTPYEVAGRSVAPCRRAACCSSAPPTRSATST